MVIGGAELYLQTLVSARRLYLTQMLARLHEGDAVTCTFPRLRQARSARSRSGITWLMTDTPTRTGS